MLIVTQVGEIVNFDRMESVFVENACAAGDGSCKVVAHGGSGKCATLGWYDNRERAWAIMREITNEYYAGQRVYQMPRE